jgi:hypothetical protein
MAHATVEQCGARLDVRDLAREGLLNGDHWTTSWGGMPLEVFDNAVWIRFQSWGELRRQTIPLERTRCHLGGSRAWFRCPSPGCGKRVAVLHHSGSRFACRRCHGLVYRTQQEAPDGRLLIRAERIWSRLGCAFGDEPQKPKWMQWRRFNRMADQASAAYLASFHTGKIARLLARADR